MMDTDFPAAHSADTVWFAVDRDGHVGFFESGEAGAVPEGALSGEAAYQMRDRLARLLPATEVIQDFRGRQVPGRADRPARHLGSVWQGWSLLMFLESADPVQQEIAAGQAEVVPASEGIAVILRGISEETYQRLHDSGACHACTWHDYEEGEHEEPPDLAAHGLYCYSHLTENWISGPYGLEVRPGRPIHIDQLPPDVRNLVKHLRFDTLSFADTPHVQPVEHTECVSWEVAYMDVTGKRIRPIPGREEQYAESYEQYARFRDSYEVEPPAAEEE